MRIIQRCWYCGGDNGYEEYVNVKGKDCVQNHGLCFKCFCVLEKHNEVKISSLFKR